MSVQDLLQKDVKQVAGANIRLLISSLPSDYTVEVNRKLSEIFVLKNFEFLEIHRTVKKYE